MAHSLFDQNPQLQAKPCTDVCPHLPIYRMAKAYIPYHRTGSINGSISSPGSVLLGMNIPDRFGSVRLFDPQHHSIPEIV